MSEREWISRIEDRELRERVRRVVAELLLLSEVSAVALQPMTRGGKNPSKAPPGVRFDRGDKAPPKDAGLWRHFSWRFQQAASSLDFELLVEEAEQEIQIAKKGLPEGRMAIVANYNEERDIRLLIEGDPERDINYTGLHSATVAVRTGWPQGWVRLIRTRNDLDPDYGRARPQWRNLSPEARQEAIATLREDEGLSQRECALRLGVSKRSVQMYWPKAEAA